MPLSQDPQSGLIAVCIRCGAQGPQAARCASCGGAVIQTRQGQAVRDSRPELSRSLRLPGIDEPARRFARGTQPPVEGSVIAAVLAPEPEPAPRGRTGLAVTATLVSAGVLGLIAALLQSSL
jgi:hypothetical protein